MARHPEVTEEEIIQAGRALEATGKRPNPGAIRAQLGYRGGLLRIKSVWTQHIQARESALLPTQRKELTFEVLPKEYADNALTFIEKVNAALEQLVIEAYTSGQTMFERRFAALENSHNEQLCSLKEAETAADDSIQRLEEEVSQLQRELEDIAMQNATLLLENAELKGRISVLNGHIQTQSKLML